MCGGGGGRGTEGFLKGGGGERGTEGFLKGGANSELIY